MASALDIAAFRGRLGFIGINVGGSAPAALGMIQSKELQMTGTIGSPDVWPQTIRFMSAAGIDLSPMVSTSSTSPTPSRHWTRRRTATGTSRCTSRRKGDLAFDCRACFNAHRSTVATVAGGTMTGNNRFRSMLGASRGLTTITAACVLLFVCSAVFASSSVSKGALLGMLPFASVLAIVALGQTLVIQQAGIDLSVAGAVSVVVVITTHTAQGQTDRLLGAVLFALVVVLAAGIANGVLVAVLGLNPIVATLGTNTLLTAVVFAVSDGSRGRPPIGWRRSPTAARLGIPNAVYFAVGITIITTTLVKSTVFGRH